MISSYLDSHDNLASMMFVLTSYFSVLTVTLMVILLRQRYTFFTSDVSVDKLEWVNNMEPHLKYNITPVSTGKVNEGQYPVQCQVLRINKGLFTNPAAILLPTLRAADVTLPAV